MQKQHKYGQLRSVHIKMLANYNLYGLNVPQSCDLASKYYLFLADAVMDENLSPIVGAKLPLYPSKKLVESILDRSLQVFEKGVFGMAKKSSALSGADVLSYYEYTAGRGDVNAMLVLGQVHYSGTASAAR